MPKQGFMTVTVTEETHEKLSVLAEKNKRSIPKTIEYLVDEHNKKEET